MVEKERFLSLTKNFTSLSADEAAELTSLQHQFPYSQIIHNLAARASRDNDLDSQEASLHLSAVYATDRAVLKSIMTSPRTSRWTEEPKVVDAKEEKVITPAPAGSVTPVPGQFTDEFFKEMTRGLKRLKEQKQNFEALYNPTDSANDSPPDEKKRIKKLSLPEAAPVELIEEIKISKKKIKPEGPKQKEQIEIIDEFIKTRPSIGKNKLASPPEVPTDLSEASILFSENIVSETLVDLLLKQGKKDKAIEVLKKLIWKFPQKKAYFAAQIEELKK